MVEERDWLLRALSCSERWDEMVYCLTMAVNLRLATEGKAKEPRRLFQVEDKGLEVLVV